MNVIDETMNTSEETVLPKSNKSRERAPVKTDTPARPETKPVAVADNVELPVAEAPKEFGAASEEIAPGDSLDVAAVEQYVVANSPIANTPAPVIDEPVVHEDKKSPEPEAIPDEVHLSKTEPAHEQSPVSTPSEPERKVDDPVKNDEDKAVETAQAVNDNPDKADIPVSEPVVAEAQPQVESVKSTPSVTVAVKRDEQGPAGKNAPPNKTLNKSGVASIENVGSNSMPSRYQYAESLKKAESADTLKTSESHLIPPPPPRLNDIEIALLLPAQAGDIKLGFYHREHPMDIVPPGKRKNADITNAAYVEQEADKGRRQMAYSVLTGVKGTYVMFIEHEGADTHSMEARIIVYAGRPNKRNRTYADMRVEGAGRSRKLFIFPEAVFWDDDKWFSGYAESSDTITKFNTETGLVWKELRIDLDSKDESVTQLK